MSAWPISLAAPSRALPPGGRRGRARPSVAPQARGVREAAALRPPSKAPRSGAKAARAPAVTGPVPGTVHRRRSSASTFDAASGSPASRSTTSTRRAICSRWIAPLSQTASGRSLTSSARACSSTSRLPGPSGRHQPELGRMPLRAAPIRCVLCRTRHGWARNGRRPGRPRFEPDRRRAALRLGALDGPEAPGRARGGLRGRLGVVPCARAAAPGPQSHLTVVLPPLPEGLEVDPARSASPSAPSPRTAEATIVRSPAPSGAHGNPAGGRDAVKAGTRSRRSFVRNATARVALTPCG